jgi:hypothetical protein
MKIGVCISGGVRYPHLALKSIKKIIPNNFVKVFIHTWKVNNVETYLKTIWGLEYKDRNKILDTNFSIFNEYNYESLLIENYDSKEKIFKNIFETLKFLKPNNPEDTPRTDIGPISMHYSIHKANELKKRYEREHNMQFDWVIRMRTDSDFKKDCLNLHDLSNILNIPEGEDWRENAINDQFAIGTSYAMDLYSNLYNNIFHTQTTEYYPEVMLNTYLKHVNLNPSRIDFPVRINDGNDFKKIWYPHLL